MTPRQKATELIKRFTACQVRNTKSKQEAIASSIMFVELFVNENGERDLDLLRTAEDYEFWLSVRGAIINTN